MYAEVYICQNRFVEIGLSREADGTNAKPWRLV